MTAAPDPREHEMDDLVQRCARIQDTASTEGWPLICDVIRERIAAGQNKLAFGRCTSMEDYRATAAEIEALTWVIGDANRPGIPGHVQAKVNTLRAQRAEDREAAAEDNADAWGVDTACVDEIDAYLEKHDGE